MIHNATFHHIGIATTSIQATSLLYAEHQRTDVVFDPIQNVKAAFLQRDGYPQLELVEPVDKTSPVYTILKKMGVTAYHFCYEVDSLSDSIEELEKKDFRLLVEPVSGIAFDNRKICFLHHIDVGLIELLEK
jgi:methylmalonyl-CoA/ethylmalonyl-CoA epimerase